MKVLITGASGQLGTFVIRALRERHDVVLMSRQQPDEDTWEGCGACSAVSLLVSGAHGF